MFLISLLLTHNFLKQHKTDLEQDPLALASTVKSSTHQPLDFTIAFKAKFLLILVPSLLHTVHMASVLILHLLRLVGDGSVSDVEARQKEVR